MKKYIITTLMLLLMFLLVSCRSNQSLKDYVFFYNESLKGYVVSKYTGSDEVIVVPSRYEKKPVIQISPTAFSFTTVRHLTIPSSVEVIDLSFLSMFQLERIEVDEKNQQFKAIDGVLYSKDGKTLIHYPQAKINYEFSINDTVTKIGSAAFTQTSNLKVLNVGNHVEVIGEYAFQYSQIENIKFTLDSQLNRIETGAFSGSSIKEITLPETVVAIDDYAFENTTIETLLIPKNTLDIGLIFNQNSQLKSFEVDPDNTAFKAIDGILYNKEVTELIWYPKHHLSTHYQVVSTISKISPTLNDANYLKTVTSLSPDFVSVDNVLFNQEKSHIVLYPKLRDETFFHIPLNLRALEDNENFMQNQTLKTLTIDDYHTAYAVSNNALYNKTLTTLYFLAPKVDIEFFMIYRYVEVIHYDGFNNANIKAITVDSHNPYFKAVDGVLYNDDLSEILYYPKAKTDTVFALLNTVINIRSGALDNDYIEQFAVEPDGRYSVIDDVLYLNKGNSFKQLIKYPSAKKNTTFELPRNVDSIASLAFKNVATLTEINTYKPSPGELELESDSLVNMRALNKITLSISSRLREDSIMNCPNVTIYFRDDAALKISYWQPYWNINNYPIVLMDNN